MTNESCASFCSPKGYTIFGREYARECFCSNYIKTYRSSKYDDSSCSMPCTGNAAEPCGAGGFLTIYRTNGPLPTIHEISNGYQYMGCQVDDQKQRNLAHALHYSDNSPVMTVDLCTGLCQKAGYSLAGLEFGGECWCDNVLASSASNADYDACGMTCNGNHNEWCGDRDRMDIYILTPPPPAGWQNSGCYSDYTFQRSLGVAMSVPGDYNNMTVEGCTSSYLAAGYPLAGVEYGRECHCASAGDNKGFFNAFVDGRCNLVCTGNNLELCGGPDHLNLYTYIGPPAIDSKLNLVHNPSFENRLDAWAVVFDHTYDAGQILTSPYFELALNTQSGPGIAHSGTSSAGISGYNDGSLQNQKRGICIQQYVYVPQAGSYILDFNIGSIQTQPHSDSYTISHQASFANHQWSGPVCHNNDTGPYCNVQSVDGRNLYSLHSFDLALSQGYEVLEICGEYDGIRPGQEDFIIIDDVHLTFQY